MVWNFVSYLRSNDHLFLYWLLYLLEFLSIIINLLNRNNALIYKKKERKNVFEKNKQLFFSWNYFYVITYKKNFPTMVLLLGLIDTISNLMFKFLLSGSSQVLFSPRILHSSMTSRNFIVLTFEENGMFMLGELFCYQPIFGNRNNSFWQTFFIPQWRYWLLEIKKMIFYLWSFFAMFWEFRSWQFCYALV